MTIGFVVIFLLYFTCSGVSNLLVPSTSEAIRASEAREIARLKAALKKFRRDCGRYPKTQEGLIALITEPAGMKGWKGPYVEYIPVDPWDRDYVYEKLGPERIKLAGYGEDGKPGGDGDDADVEDTIQGLTVTLNIRC